jgi:acyl-CoA:6-aminopenicillanic acid acyl transferase
MCTNIGATGRTVGGRGKVYIGSVSDDPYDIRTRVIVRRPKGGYGYVGTDLRPLGAAGSAAEYSASVSGAPTRGLNEKGLAFTWALAFEKPENKARTGALKPHDLWDAVMRKCDTVDEALDHLANMPRDMGGVALLADRKGGLARAEIGRRKIEVTDRLSLQNGGATINVNCWTAMQATEGDLACSLDVPTVPNGSRYERARTRLGEVDGRIDFDAMTAILSDHGHKERFAGDNTMVRGHGFSICNHGSLRKPSFDADDPAWGSVSAEIIDPVGGVFWYAYGWPCGEASEYGDQMLQEHSWGTFLGFPVAALPEGAYTTLTGELTPLAIRHVDSLAISGALRRLERETALSAAD